MSEAPDEALAIEAVERSYGTVKALAGVSLSVARGEFLTLLGPSGSGKTTLLRAIAGFETLSAGKITLEGRDLSTVKPSHRDIGMVFQSYALFPHMTVAENVAFPLKMRGMSRRDIAARVEEALAKMHLAGYGARHPRQLSGGQQQRVALARAIVFQPKLLLLDEPFGALDRKLREGMQEEVRTLQRRLGLTTIFITHDQEEALVMSDRIAVMRSGVIQQIGAPREIYTRPTNLFTADFLGESNLLPGSWTRDPNGAPAVEILGGTLVSAIAPAEAPGSPITILVRPEHVRPARAGITRDVALPCSVTDVIYLGNAVRYRLQGPGGLQLSARGTADDPVLGAGDVAEFGWNAADAHVLVS